MPEPVDVEDPLEGELLLDEDADADTGGNAYYFTAADNELRQRGIEGLRQRADGSYDPNHEEILEEVKRWRTEIGDASYIDPETQQLLARFSGLQSLHHSAYELRFGEYALQGEALHAARMARRTSVATPPLLTNAVWRLLAEHGFDGGRILDIGCGSAGFFGAMPPAMRARSQLTGIDLDPISVTVSQALCPDAVILQGDLTSTRLPNTYYDVVLSDVPDTMHRIADDQNFHRHNLYQGDYVAARAMLHTRPGGLCLLLAGHSFMQRSENDGRVAVNALGGALLGSVEIDLGGGRLGDLVVLQNNPELAAAQAAAEDSWLQMRTIEIPASEYLQGRGDVRDTVVQWPPTVMHADEIEEMMAARPRLEAPNEHAMFVEVNAASVAAWGDMGLTPQVVGYYAPMGHPFYELPDVLTNSAAWRDHFKARPQVGFVEDIPDNTPDTLQQRIAKLSATLPETLLLPAADMPAAAAPGRALPAAAPAPALADNPAHVQQHLPLAPAGAPTIGRVDYLEDQEQFGSVVACRVAGDQVVVHYDLLPPVRAAEQRRIRSLIEMRDQVRLMLHIQGSMDAELDATEQQVIDAGIATLNQMYQTHTERWDLLSSRGLGVLAIDVDADYLKMLEVDGGHENDVRGLILRQRVAHAPTRLPAQVDDFTTALSIALQEDGRILPERLSALLNQPFAEILAANEGQLFLSPETQEWQLRSIYLTGNVAQKLADAKAAALVDERFENNIPALESVLPDPLESDQVGFSFGAHWLPPEIYLAYLDHSLGQEHLSLDGLSLQYNTSKARWQISVPHMRDNPVLRETLQRNGVKGMHYAQIFTSGLNGNPPNIKVDTTTPGDGPERVQDTEATIQAQQIIDDLNAEFMPWLLQDEERMGALADIYNGLYLVHHAEPIPEIHYTPPGLSQDYALYPHQERGLVRGLLSPLSTGFFHAVGSGKTLLQASLAVEGKRHGLYQKPMLAVPNSMLGQSAMRLREYYPEIRMLVLTAADMRPKKHDQTRRNVAQNEWDVVLIAHQTLDSIDVLPATRRLSKQDRLALLERANIAPANTDAARGQARHDRALRRSREKEMRNLRAELIAMEQAAPQHPDTLTFEDLGIDYLLVDECQEYKNLKVETALKIPGVNTNSTQKTESMMLKARALRELHGGQSKGLAFFSGTPVTNSIAEMYVIGMYLRPEVWREVGAEAFDSWVKNFGKAVNALEMYPEGTNFRIKQRLAQFINLPELLSAYRTFADIQTGEMVNLDVPEMIRNIVDVPMTQWQKDYMQEMLVRAHKVRNDRVNPRDDNLLWVQTNGRQAALDLRLLNPDVPTAEGGGKLAVCADNVAAVYRDSAERRSTQIVFCDQGVPKSEAQQAQKRSFQLYHELRNALQERGVAAADIAFAQDAKSGKQRAALQQQMRTGEVRVVIASVQQFGMGVDVQNRLVAVHELDCPWRPDIVDQRRGRMIRQGNENEQGTCFTYVTKDSFDVFMYATNDRKARFTTMAMLDPALTPREATYEADMTYAEIMVVTTGNEMLRVKVELDNEVRQQERAQRTWDARRRRNRNAIPPLTDTVARMRAHLDTFDVPMHLMVEARAAHPPPRPDGKAPNLLSFTIPGQHRTTTALGAPLFEQTGDTTWLSHAPESQSTLALDSRMRSIDARHQGAGRSVAYREPLLSVLGVEFYLVRDINTRYHVTDASGLIKMDREWSFPKATKVAVSIRAKMRNLVNSRNKQKRHLEAQEDQLKALEKAMEAEQEWPHVEELRKKTKQSGRGGKSGYERMVWVTMMTSCRILNCGWMCAACGGCDCRHRERAPGDRMGLKTDQVFQDQYNLVTAEIAAAAEPNLDPLAAAGGMADHEGIDALCAALMPPWLRLLMTPLILTSYGTPSMRPC